MTDIKASAAPKAPISKPRPVAKKESEDRPDSVLLRDGVDGPDRADLVADPPGHETVSAAPGPEEEAPPFQPVEEADETSGSLNPFLVFATIHEQDVQPREVLETSVRFTREFADIARGSIDAMLASSRAVVRVAGAVGDEAVEYGRLRCQRVSTSLRSLAEIRSPGELIKLQSDHVQSALDDAMAESARLQERLSELLHELTDSFGGRPAGKSKPIRTRAA